MWYSMHYFLGFEFLGILLLCLEVLVVGNSYALVISYGVYFLKGVKFQPKVEGEKFLLPAGLTFHVGVGGGGGMVVGTGKEEIVQGKIRKWNTSRKLHTHTSWTLYTYKSR